MDNQYTDNQNNTPAPPQDAPPQNPGYQAPPPQGFQPPPQGFTPPPPQYGTPVNPGKAMSITSMVLGICGLVIPYVGTVAAIVGLILGIMGKKKSQEVGAPTGMATAGIVLSIIGIAGSILLIACIVCVAAGTFGSMPWYF